MVISGINSGSSHHTTRKIHTFTEQPAFSLNVEKNVSHTQDAKKWPPVKGYADLNDPKVKADLEALALPDWFVSLLPKEAVSNPTLGMSYNEMYKVTGNEKAVNYCKTKLSDVTCDESLKSEISSAERYSLKKTQPDLFKDYDDKLFQSVRKRLLADETYVNYMKFLGIPI